MRGGLNDFRRPVRRPSAGHDPVRRGSRALRTGFLPDRVPDGPGRERGRARLCAGGPAPAPVDPAPAHDLSSVRSLDGLKVSHGFPPGGGGRSATRVTKGCRRTGPARIHPRRVGGMDHPLRRGRSGAAWGKRMADENPSIPRPRGRLLFYGVSDIVYHSTTASYRRILQAPSLRAWGRGTFPGRADRPSGTARNGVRPARMRLVSPSEQDGRTRDTRRSADVGTGCANLMTRG